MNALAGLMNPAAVGQSFQQGMEIGRQRRAEEETRNALSSLVTNPLDTEAVGNLAKYNPQAAMAMQDRQRAMQAEQAKQQQIENEQNLFRAAIGGDEKAMDELAVQSFDKWKQLDKSQKDKAAQEAKIFANAALDILNRPPEQRGAALQAYAQQLGQEYPEVQQVLQLPPEQQEAALRAAVAEGALIERLLDREQPKYMAIPQGGTLVDTRNPQALQTFGQAPQAGAVEDGYRFKGGDPANPGNWEKVGGPSQQAAGSFPQP